MQDSTRPVKSPESTVLTIFFIVATRHSQTKAIASTTKSQIAPHPAPIQPPAADTRSDCPVSISLPGIEDVPVEGRYVAGGYVFGTTFAVAVMETAGGVVYAGFVDTKAFVGVVDEGGPVLRGGPVFPGIALDVFEPGPRPGEPRKWGVGEGFPAGVAVELVSGAVGFGGAVEGHLDLATTGRGLCQKLVHFGVHPVSEKSIQEAYNCNLLPAKDLTNGQGRI